MREKEKKRERGKERGKEKGSSKKKPIVVVGIFEASVAASLMVLGGGGTSMMKTDEGAGEHSGKKEEEKEREAFGIISTGKVWEALLSKGVYEMLGVRALDDISPASSSSLPCARFAGVETTGLNATELHDAPQDEVKRRIQDATRRLVKLGNVRVVILGCAGMAGMEEWVGEVVDRGKVRIVDGVKAGVGALQMLIRAGF